MIKTTAIVFVAVDEKKCVPHNRTGMFQAPAIDLMGLATGDRVRHTRDETT